MWELSGDGAQEMTFADEQAFKDAYPADDCDPDFVKWMKEGDADIGWAGDPTFECTPDVNPFNTAPWNQPAPGSKKTGPLTEPEKGPRGGYLVPYNDKCLSHEVNDGCVSGQTGDACEKCDGTAKVGCPNTNRMLWLESVGWSRHESWTNICTGTRFSWRKELAMATCISGDAWYKVSLEAISGVAGPPGVG